MTPPYLSKGISIRRMTQAEYGYGGDRLCIRYGFARSPFGDLLAASTSKGLCSLYFADDHETALDNLVRGFPNATCFPGTDKIQRDALAVFTDGGQIPDIVRLHLHGTAFQLKVWETLLEIPTGTLATYKEVAARAGTPKACRAVGTAIGKNPIALLIPCHRVIRSSGETGGYRWGTWRKTAIIEWEAARCGNS